LDDTNFWHYSLQLNTYKAIIEEKYGRKVVELCLVCLHPNNADYQLIPVPFLEKEMVDLFEYRKQMLRDQKAGASKAAEKKASSHSLMHSLKPSPSPSPSQKPSLKPSATPSPSVAPKGASTAAKPVGKGLLLDLNNM
jgi:hypothetical protein